MDKEVYFKPHADLFINSNDVESFCIEIHNKKYKNILFGVMYIFLLSSLFIVVKTRDL